MTRTAFLVKVGITVRLGIISRFGFLGLVLSLGSCLAITKIWNDGPTTAQAGRISKLSHHTNNSKQGTVYSHSSDRYFIRQGIVHSRDMGVGQPQKSGRDSSWLPILYFLSPPPGSALCKIGFVPTISKERESKWVYT